MFSGKVRNIRLQLIGASYVFLQMLLYSLIISGFERKEEYHNLNTKTFN